MADGITIEWDQVEMAAIQHSLDEMQSGAQRVAANAAIEAAKAELDAAKGAAPVKTGNLRKSLVLHMERNSAKGKQVFDILPTPHMNNILQKQVLYPGRSASGKKRKTTAYYPASQEYGFATRAGGRVPGKYYMGGTMDAGANSYRESMLQEIEKNIDEAWGDK